MPYPGHDPSQVSGAVDPGGRLRILPPLRLPVFTDHKDTGVFVGLWVPSILALGAFTLTAIDQRGD